MRLAPRIVLLGPQRHEPIVIDTLRSMPSVDPHAPVAIISAGWEEREREIEEFEKHVGVRAINLELYNRIEAVYAKDPGFHEAVRERHDTLRALQELYRVRLAHGLAAARELLARSGNPALIEPEREAALEAVRAIDAHHLARVLAIHAEFDAKHRPAEHPLITRHREQIEKALAECSALCIAGGHVAVLLNRLRSLNPVAAWKRGPILAWGAGAMALGERVVLFHDHPPQGAGNAEVLDAGLGIAPGVVPLPHAAARLHLEDKERVQLFAKRFSPAQCIALDPRCRADWSGARWRGVSGARQLAASGALEDVA